MSMGVRVYGYTVGWFLRFAAKLCGELKAVVSFFGQSWCGWRRGMSKRSVKVSDARVHVNELVCVCVCLVFRGPFANTFENMQIHSPICKYAS